MSASPDTAKARRQRCWGVPPPFCCPGLLCILARVKLTGTEEQQDVLRHVIDKVMDPVFLVDKEFNVWLYNAAFEAAIGVPLEGSRFRALPCYQLLGLDICDNNCVMKRAIAEQGSVNEPAVQGFTAGERDVNFRVNAEPLYNNQDQPIGSLVFLRDMTTETQLQQKYNDLVARNAAMSLSGVIEDGNLADAVQLFIFLRKSGHLMLRSGEVDGEMVFQNGQITAVQVGRAQGRKALGRMLEWQEGQFAFTPRVPENIPATVETPAEMLLMDALREKDELNGRRAELPPKNAVLRAEGEPAETDLTELERSVFHLIAQGCNALEVLELLDHTDAAIYQAMLSLRDRGALAW